MASGNGARGTGDQAGKMYRRETLKEEAEVERAKGGDLRKGKDRFEERADSAFGDCGVDPSGRDQNDKKNN